MTINVTNDANECRVVLSGEIDERGAELMKQRFRELQQFRARRVVIDFKEVIHIGSAGIGKLLVLYKDLAVHDAQLKIVNVPHAIYLLMSEMRLNTIFTITESPT